MALSLVGKRLIFNRVSLLVNQKRNGYIVLVPEIGEEPSGKNPLIREDNLPEFNNVTIENCVAGIGHQALDLEKKIRAIENYLKENKQINDVFKEVIEPIEHEFSPLETTWGLAKTIYLGNSTLMPTKSYLSIHDRARKASAMKFNSLPIYQTITKALENPSKFNDEQIRVLEKYALESKLNGIALSPADRHLLNETLNKINSLKIKYKERIDTIVKQFKHYIHDVNLMQEFPPHLLQAMADDENQPIKGPWKVSLQPYIVKSFLEYCPNHDMRWNLWQANNRKASGYNDKTLNNSSTLEEIRGFRHDQAKLLGYKNYAEMSMETKMLGSIEAVEKMLATLLQKARVTQDEEINQLIDFAEANGFKHKFEIYDVPYWKRRQLLEQFDYDEEAIRDYFPSPKVLEGMFKISEQLFGIKIEERSGMITWDEDVKLYDVFDANNSKEPIGGFYIDLYSREDEKIVVQGNTGWMIGIRNRSTITNTKPLAALIFNFPAPIYGKPSLLSLKDIHQLFFKFGQTLQHLLTKANYSDVAGLSNLSWDIVETSGNLMTHLLYNPTILKTISSHYSTGDSIPDKKVEAIHRSRSHLNGFHLCEEIYLCTLDLELHKSKEFWLDIVKNLYPKHFVFEMDKKDSLPCSFLQIFSGEWGAAYFSHLHARVIAADIYSAFQEASKIGEADVIKVGHRFKDTFLSLGGSCKPQQLFRKFRGRDPSLKALLKTIESNK
uniref:CSON011765 protein n=1 Tax=Culicoides sonorensis TaxID=179676 RepID=A0A336M3W8_CULSO